MTRADRDEMFIREQSFIEPEAILSPEMEEMVGSWDDAWDLRREALATEADRAEYAEAMKYLPEVLDAPHVETCLGNCDECRYWTGRELGLAEVA